MNEKKNSLLGENGHSSSFWTSNLLLFRIHLREAKRKQKNYSSWNQLLSEVGDNIFLRKFVISRRGNIERVCRRGWRRGALRKKR